MQSKVFLLFIFVLSLWACDSNQVYDQYQTVGDSWNKNDTKTFTVTPPDSTNAYNLFVNLRNTNAYKYNNLYLIVEINFPHGKTVTDTLEYRMAAPDGTLLGTGFTDVKENKLWYKEQVVFKESGDYKVNIKHAMREHGKVNGVTNLDGITEVGFRVEKVTP